MATEMSQVIRKTTEQANAAILEGLYEKLESTHSMLMELQEDQYRGTCPVCGALDPVTNNKSNYEGHASNCRLATALRSGVIDRK